MALSFVGAYYATSSELKRKENQGLLHSFKQVIVTYRKSTATDWAIQLVFGAVLGYKILDMILNYDAFVRSPQQMILSPDGSIAGLIVGIGIAAYLKYREDEKNKGKAENKEEVTMHPYQLMWNVVFIAAISGLLGAKLFHNLENLDEFMRDPVDALLSFSGLTFYGGLILATISVLYYTGKHGVPWIHMIDAAAPGLMLAYGIGRIGCQLSGDGDWGIINTAPIPDLLNWMPQWMWGFTYPHNVINEGIQIPGCDGLHCFELAQPVFPTPFYESVAAIGLAGFLWAIRTRISIPGMLFCIYLMVNGIERFMIEKIRVNNTYHIGSMHITQAEIISSILFLIGLIGTILLLQKKKSQPQ